MIAAAAAGAAAAAAAVALLLLHWRREQKQKQTNPDELEAHCRLAMSSYARLRPLADLQAIAVLDG